MNVLEKAHDTVHVLTYSHKHGTDVSVFAKHELAVIAVYDIVLEYLADVDNVNTRKNIREAIKARDFAKVSQLWAEAMEEGFDIDACCVFTYESEADLDAAIDAAIKASEEDDAKDDA